MNIGKLLAAGKSIINGRTEVSYRFNKQIYLPKFDSAKNPFAIPAKAAAKATAETPAPAGKQTPAAAPKSPEPSPAVARKAGWTSRLNPISMLRQAPETKNEQPTVQAELSLDSVKVVQNDLTDADVEVVPIKSRSGAADLPPAKKSWEILGERLLKVTAL